MATLRGITKDIRFTLGTSITKYQIKVREGEEYEKAKALMEKYPEILFCYYWNDEDEKARGFYTYPIERSDCS